MELVPLFDALQYDKLAIVGSVNAAAAAVVASADNVTTTSITPFTESLSASQLTHTHTNSHSSAKEIDNSIIFLYASRFYAAAAAVSAVVDVANAICFNIDSDRALIIVWLSAFECSLHSFKNVHCLLCERMSIDCESI